MRSFTPKAVVAVSTVFLAANVVLAADDSSVGCYKSKQSKSLMEKGDTFNYQSIGHCKGICIGKGKPLLALTKGSDCYCSDKIPSDSSKTSNDECETPCQGYPENICGGDDVFSVYLTGKEKLKDIEVEGGGGGGGGDGGASPTSSDSDGPTTTNQAGHTVIVTESSSSDGEENKDDGGPNTAGIAAGVVVGVVALVAVIGGAWFFTRRRRQKAIEEEHNRTATIDNFVAGGNKPNSSSSMSDSRLDPTMMAHRRQSDGSIADNQDFSRRILQVTNPDGR